MPEEKIRPSATVILWRRVPTLEVYLVERSQQTRFFPGYHAFPGGVIDDADGEGPDARRRAAIRELAEETGVAVPADALVPAGRLVTPAFGPVRYDTSFFTCEAPAGAEPQVDGKEHASGKWWRPADALSAFETSAMPIPPPTLAYLRLLHQHQDAEKAAAAARETDGRPHHERFRIEIHPGIYVLPLRAPTLPPATTQNCYLLDGDPILLIDPGTPYAEEQEALFHTLDGMLKEDEREILVLLTHHHMDHVSAVDAVQRRYGVRVLASQETRDILTQHIVDGVIAEGHVFDIGEWAGKPWRVEAAASGASEEKDSTRRAPKGVPWRVEVLHTPGHTPGHLVFRDMRWGAIFSGDLVSGVSTILVDPDEGNMSDYMRSLERCSALEPKLVLPGHGPALPRDAFAETLTHRKMREARVLQALTKDAQTAQQLAPTVYSDTPPEAWPLAERNLLSHLLRLEEKALAARAPQGGWISTR